MCRDRTALAALLLAGLSGMGCAPGPVPVEIRIVHGALQDPWEGADTIRIVLEIDGEEADAWTFGIDALDPTSPSSGILPSLPAGSDLVLRVEALAGDTVLAGGRSYPFDLVEGASAPHADVYVGVLGKFAEPIAGADPGDVRAVVTTSDGALLANALGELHRFRAHDRRPGHTGEPTMEVVGVVEEPEGRSYVDVPDGRILAFGGAAGGALLYDSDGALLAALPAEALSLQAFGAAAVGLPSGEVVLAGGSPSADGVATGAVLRLDVSVSSDGAVAITAQPLPPLPTPRRDAQAVATSANCQLQLPCERVLVAGGTNGGARVAGVVAIDPADMAGPPYELATPLARPGATLLPFEPGVVIVAGGDDELGAATDLIGELRVLEDLVVSVAVTPPPDPLFLARRSGAGLVFGPRLALVVGGVDGSGAPSMTAELIERPGSSLPTGSLPSPIAAPRTVLLGDGTALVAGDGELFLYVLPRWP